MASLLDDGIAWLNEQLAQHASETVSLTRGNKTTTGVVASWERQVSRAYDPEEVPTTAVMRLWWIEIADYAFSGATAIPQPGDVVTQTDGTQWAVSPTQREPAYEKNEDHWMVRTKQVS